MTKRENYEKIVKNEKIKAGKEKIKIIRLNCNTVIKILFVTDMT